MQTPEGKGTVVSTQVICGTCKVQLDDSDDAPKTFACSDCCIIKSGKRKCENKKNDTDELDILEEDTKLVASEEPDGEKPRRKRNRNNQRKRKKSSDDEFEHVTE